MSSNSWLFGTYKPTHAISDDHLMRSFKIFLVVDLPEVSGKVNLLIAIILNLLNKSRLPISLNCTASPWWLVLCVTRSLSHIVMHLTPIYQKSDCGSFKLGS